MDQPLAHARRVLVNRALDGAERRRRRRRELESTGRRPLDRLADPGAVAIGGSARGSFCSACSAQSTAACRGRWRSRASTSSSFERDCDASASPVPRVLPQTPTRVSS
jgi:hypothetical protein